MKLDTTKAIFAAGAVVGVATMKILKTKKVRDLTINSLASGKILKDKVLEEVANLREEADDVYEAKKESQAL